MSRICITGMGAISAIGNSVADNRAALQQGITGIQRESQFASRYAGTLPFGEVKTSTAGLQEQLNITAAGVTRTSLLALHALQEAIADAGLSQELLMSGDTALIGASTVGGMCLTDELYNDANSKTGEGSPYVSSYDNASVTLFLQQYFHIGGIVNTINTACSSSANAIAFGARLINSGLAKRAIVGGADSLAKFTINGFKALHILSAEPCAPFDADRSGLNLGEAGAFLILEKEEYLAGRKAYGVVSGYGNSNDSFHPSSISAEGEGPFLSMQRAMDKAGLTPSSIDVINAHGTATENNDETESVAMQRLFGKVPVFMSTKSYTGHTLGAAGAIEAIYSLLKLYHGEIYGSLHFNQPIAATGLVPQLQYTNMDIQHIMSNSFGFGGNCSSLVFSKIG
ncbi:beta-ketoacyl-[acyl-carrier-protein] synthase family protein [Terrimonas rubra]|uniref:Beta-ketoacyl-[acyl-carrier-protein] synthase family protein n=1 Tax=Terrimonas rubra TaxID=1035890 RepID=A0ABW6A1P6_9BACT